MSAVKVSARVFFRRTFRAVILVAVPVDTQYEAAAPSENIMTNAVNPDGMTDDERLDEVADILAAGFLRAR